MNYSYSTSGAMSPGAAVAISVVYGIILLWFIITMWKTFTKANQYGWASLVPIYNMVVLFRISGKPGWWVLLMFIPFVNLVVLILQAIGLAKNFGKGAGFAAGLILLSPIFYAILAFGKSSYNPES